MFSLALLPCVMVVAPLVGALLVLVLSRNKREQARWTALTNVLFTLILAIVMVLYYKAPSPLPANADLTQIQDTALNALQFGSSFSWVGEGARSGVPAIGTNVQFFFAVDGISLWMIVLSALLMVPAVLVSWNAIEEKAPQFYALMLMLQAGMIGVFAAQDIILFYIFFEFTLIPLFFMIGIWGGSDRRWAARKFFIYTLAGSVLTFLGLMFIVLTEQWMSNNPTLTFSIPELTLNLQRQVASNPEYHHYWQHASPWVFAALFAGFAIKVPLFPFHTWLPLAHVEAPTAGSVLLAGVLLKIGSYGFLRFALPLVPDASMAHFHMVAILAVIGIIYGALLALAQEDIKKLVAYSSVSHMGFCVLGLFAFNTVGLTGGLLQMINHGLSTGALFALVGMLYERYHTRDIASYGGLARKYPRMAFCMIVVAFSSIGLPGLNGFTGEVTSLMGMFAANKIYAVLSLSGIILGAWYTLFLVRRIFFGKFREPATAHTGAHGHAGTAHSITAPAAHSHAGHSHSDHGHAGHGQGGHGHGGHDAAFESSPHRDLDLREMITMAVLIIPIVWIGLYPQFFTSRMLPSLQPIVAILHQKSVPQVAQDEAATKASALSAQADSNSPNHPTSD